MLLELNLRESICKEARSFTGTPYHDRAWLKGIGVDCATFAMMVYRSVGLVPADYKLPDYYPQQWLRNDKEDRTYLNEVEKFAVEISKEEAKPGDLALVKLARSFTHGAILLTTDWTIIHAVADSGCVVMGNLEQDLAWKKRLVRYFSFVKKHLNEGYLIGERVCG